MNVQKLLTLRKGYRRLIADVLSKFEMDRMSNYEFERLHRLLTETADGIKMINEEITYHDDVEDLATEIFESKKYSFAIELKLFLLEKQLEEQQITRIGNEQRVMSKLSPEQQQTTIGTSTCILCYLKCYFCLVNITESLLSKYNTESVKPFKPPEHGLGIHMETNLKYPTKSK